MSCKYCGVETESGWDGKTLDICKRCSAIQNESVHSARVGTPSQGGNLKSEMAACACTKCKETQHEVLVYPSRRCSHVLHAILSFLTAGLWLIVWFIIWITSENANKSSKATAAMMAKCEKCNAPLMLLSQ